MNESTASPGHRGAVLTCCSSTIRGSQRCWLSGIRDGDGFRFQAGVDPAVLSSFRSFPVARDHSREHLMKELLAGFVAFWASSSSINLGNAIIGTVAENNSHFPDRKVTARRFRSITG